MALALLRSPGSSVVSPMAGGLATDLLGAAWYARPQGERDVRDLRLAFGILATRWERQGRRLGARDLPALHRAFGGLRLGRSGGRLGTLDRETLLHGAERFIGPWFAEAWNDPARRAYGIAFETERARAAFVPERRLESAALRRLTPPRCAHDAQCWHTYAPVGLPDTEAALALLAEPARWPDFASELGRFTPLRSGGLEGQTFEIELAIRGVPRAPLWTRGYVTATRVLHADAADGYARGLEPFVGEPLGRVRAAIELTTHHGHPLGRAVSRLLVGDGWVRDVGSWDPHGLGLTAVGYRLSGARAQHEFWSGDRPERSMLAQLAAASAR